MTDSTSPTRDVATRLRRTLKAALYSGPGRDRWQHPDRVVASLGLEPGMRVADIGAGGGYFTFKLARAVGPEGRVYAVDTDADMRSLIQDQAAARGLDNVIPVEPPEDEPRLPEPVDLAFFAESFHHVPEPPSYLRGLATYLSTDGRVAVIEPRPHWWMFGHATDPSLVRAALEVAGYRVEEQFDFLARQAFVIARRIE